MGCDIHFHVEARGRGGWERVEATSPNPYADIEGEPATVRESWYRSRNYSLFAMLADVRNGHGFAGSDTGDPVVPIADPRGLPSDVSPEVRSESEQIGEDGHSHSHFSLAELLAVDWWGNEITHRGWFDIPESERGAPEQWLKRTKYSLERGWFQGDWSSGSFGSRIVAAHLDGTVTEGGTQRSAPVSTKTPTTYQIEWSTSWAAAAGGEWFQTLTRMSAEASRRESFDAVRAVFWFDN